MRTLNVGLWIESRPRYSHWQVHILDTQNAIAHALYNSQISHRQTDITTTTRMSISSLVTEESITTEPILTFFVSIWARLQADCLIILRWLQDGREPSVMSTIQCETNDTEHFHARSEYPLLYQSLCWLWAYPILVGGRCPGRLFLPGRFQSCKGISDPEISGTMMSYRRYHDTDVSWQLHPKLSVLSSLIHTCSGNRERRDTYSYSFHSY